MSNLITQGYGKNQKIITLGLGGLILILEREIYETLKSTDWRAIKMMKAKCTLKREIFIGEVDEYGEPLEGTKEIYYYTITTSEIQTVDVKEITKYLGKLEWGDVIAFFSEYETESGETIIPQTEDLIIFKGKEYRIKRVEKQELSPLKKIVYYKCYAKKVVS